MFDTFPFLDDTKMKQSSTEIEIHFWLFFFKTGTHVNSSLSNEVYKGLCVIHDIYHCHYHHESYSNIRNNYWRLF